uniref:Uncharacterized protein n=1 Tax=Sparus aurata TaxID=8175 RepID=A0A671VJI7_SPAAU
HWKFKSICPSESAPDISSVKLGTVCPPLNSTPLLRHGKLHRAPGIFVTVSVTERCRTYTWPEFGFGHIAASLENCFIVNCKGTVPKSLTFFTVFFISSLSKLLSCRAFLLLAALHYSLSVHVK